MFYHLGFFSKIQFNRAVKPKNFLIIHFKLFTFKKIDPPSLEQWKSILSLKLNQNIRNWISSQCCRVDVFKCCSFGTQYFFLILSFQSIFESVFNSIVVYFKYILNKIYFIFFNKYIFSIRSSYVTIIFVFQIIQIKWKIAKNAYKLLLNSIYFRKSLFLPGYSYTMTSSKNQWSIGFRYFPTTWTWFVF